MHKRIAIGLIVLIFVLGVAFVFYQQHTDIQQLKEELAEDKKMLEENAKPIAENDLPPPDPDKKWVPHGDHFHQVPIDAPDVWQGGEHESDVRNEPLQIIKPEPPQIPISNRKKGIYKEGINGQMLYYPPHPPFESYKHLLEDPEATIRKNAKIIVENYYSLEANHAYGELNLLNFAMHKGYVGGSMWSDEAMRLLDLKEEVLWKPLEAAGHIVRTPVPVTVEGGKTQ